MLPRPFLLTPKTSVNISFWCSNKPSTFTFYVNFSWKFLKLFTGISLWWLYLLRKRQTHTHSSSNDSFFQMPATARSGPGWSYELGIQASQVCDRGPERWAIICCSPSSALYLSFWFFKHYIWHFWLSNVLWRKWWQNTSQLPGVVSGSQLNIHFVGAFKNWPLGPAQ